MKEQNKISDKGKKPRKEPRKRGGAYRRNGQVKNKPPRVEADSPAVDLKTRFRSSNGVETMEVDPHNIESGVATHPLKLDFALDTSFVKAKEECKRRLSLLEEQERQQLSIQQSIIKAGEVADSILEQRKRTIQAAFRKMYKSLQQQENNFQNEIERARKQSGGYFHAAQQAALSLQDPKITESLMDMGPKQRDVLITELRQQVLSLQRTVEQKSRGEVEDEGLDFDASKIFNDSLDGQLEKLLDYAKVYDILANVSRILKPFQTDDGQPKSSSSSDTPMEMSFVEQQPTSSSLSWSSRVRI